MSTIEDLHQVDETPGPAAQRLRKFMDLTLERSCDGAKDSTRLRDRGRVAVGKPAFPPDKHDENLRVLIMELIRTGRDSGEFERQTPFNEVCDGIAEAVRLFSHPDCFQNRSYSKQKAALGVVVGLILRSLVPQK